MSADLETIDRALAKEGMFALIDKLEYYKKKLEVNPNINFSYREEFLLEFQALIIKHLVHFKKKNWTLKVYDGDKDED